MVDATQVQIRRGTQSQCEGMVPVEGEVICDLTNDTLRVGDGIKAGGHLMPNVARMQSGQYMFATAGGTGNAITVALAPAVAALVTGMEFRFLAVANNTGAVTVSLNGLAAVGLRKIRDGSPVQLDADDISSGVIYNVVYDGTYFVLAGQGGQQQRQYERVSISGISGTSFKLATVPAWANTINIDMNTVTTAGNNVTVALRLGIGGATGVASGYSGSYVRNVGTATTVTNISASFVLRDSPNGDYLHLIKLTRGVDSTQWSAEWQTPSNASLHWIGAGRITLASALTDLFVARTSGGSLTGGQALITFEE